MANMTTSTPRLAGVSDAESRLHTVCRSDLQRVETELEAVATSQQVESREVCRLKEAIKSIHDDLSVIKEQLARNNQGNKSSGRPKKKIPPILSSKVKNLHSNLENAFDPSLPYRHSRNQDVVQELCEQLSQEDNSFEDNLIKHAVYRYYESRRKLFNDSQPERLAAASENKKRTRKSQEQKRLFDRRQKQVKATEMNYWKVLTKDCMSDESDNDEGTKTRHSPKWQSQRLNSYLHKLDERAKNKLGRNAARVVERRYGSLREGPPPKKLPLWMVAEEYHQPTVSMETSPSNRSDAQQPTLQSTPMNYRSSDVYWSASRTLSNMYSFEELPNHNFGSVTEV